ncbi:MAG: methyltransferase domain-containing protein [Gammaproteobacteria bacterium]
MDKEMYAEMALYEDTHWWFAGRRMIIQSILDKYHDKGPDSQTLEVGCGTGGNLALLSAYGRLTAVELDDGARKTAAERNLCRVHPGSLPDKLPPDGQFDLICMLDVLEHVEQDAESIRRLAARLNPGGLLLITVPAFMFLWSTHDELHHHKRRYTLSQLENLVLAHDLTIQHATYFNTLLFPLVYSIRIVNKLFGKNWASGIRPPAPFVNRILRCIFRLEIPLLDRMRLPFGVSILVLGKKAQAACT